MSAQKKHSSVRARRNRAATAAVLTEGLVSSAVRPLPKIRVWHELTLEWWEALWTSPMSGEYHRSDWYQLIFLAIAYDRLVSDELTPVAFKHLSEEVRAHRQPFGMTPYDRRRLEWQIESSEEAKERGRSRRARQGTGLPAGADPRQALCVVGSKGDAGA